MREITIEELLKLQLDILKKIDTFCRLNSIPYTVFGGTAIGTVRHKGYIPWDDDIDIAMTRPNYERFIHSFNGAYEHLLVCAPEIKWSYYAPYANVYDNRTILNEGANGHNGMVIGVKIDVFPIDGVATDIESYHKDKKDFAKLWELLFVKRYILKNLWQINKRTALTVLIKRILSSIRSYSSIQREIRQLLMKYPYETAEYVDLKCYPWPNDSRCIRDVFEDYVDMPFENIKVSIIKDYNEYLTKSYGDYMQFPPEDKRIPHHDFTAYWKD